ncbi:hypothetical protein O0R43_28005, partial [Rhodococcus sp. A5(2022)]|nr:hypothetical protein [Rhodococcus sp. A5(2022)]
FIAILMIVLMAISLFVGLNSYNSFWRIAQTNVAENFIKQIKLKLSQYFVAVGIFPIRVVKAD